MDGIGERLKEERLRNGWSQKDLAQESKTNVDTISGIETGQHEPRPSTLRKLAKALSIEVRDLFEESALAGKGDSGAESSVYQFSGEQRVTPEQLRERGIEPNDSEVHVLNQYLELRERPPTGPVVIWHVSKENEPVDHERVKTMLAYVLASGMLTEEETAAVRDALHDELAGAKG